MNAKRPRVERVRALPFRLPLRGSLEWGRGSRLDVLEHVLVEVTLDSGAVGYAEAPPRPTIYGETVRSIVEVVEGVLRDALIGEQLAFPLPLAALANNQTARGALDMAAHHAIAEHRGVSLADALAAPSGGRRKRVRVSYILGLGETPALVEEAVDAWARGIRVFKVKTGADWQRSLTVVGALRDRFGDEVDLYADANETLEAETASARLGALRDLGVLYCEEPLPVQQVLQRAALRRAEVVPLIADDSVFSLCDLERELALDTFDILNLKPARTGYTESLAMLALARDAGRHVMVGSQAGSGLGAARAAALAGCAGIDCPSELGFFLKLERDILSEPLAIREGWMDLDQLARARIDREVLEA